MGEDPMGRNEGPPWLFPELLPASLLQLMALCDAYADFGIESRRRLAAGCLPSRKGP
jgi:hypothetical protein